MVNNEPARNAFSTADAGGNIEKDSRVYELSYLLTPSFSEEEALSIHGNLKEFITSLNGKMISDETPRIIDLAYTMSKMVKNVRNKFEKAYFSWVKFEIDPEKTADIKKKFDADDNIIRFLIIKTVKENTIASKRFVSREGGYRRSFVAKKETTSTSETSSIINKEEVDKEIEALVAEQN